MAEKIHMRFYDTSFLDFDNDHEGYSDALLSLTKVRKPHHIKAGLRFFAKYAAKKGHMHQSLCAECLQYLKDTTSPLPPTGESK